MGLHSIENERMVVVAPRDFLDAFLQQPELDAGAVDWKGRTALHIAITLGLGHKFADALLQRCPTAVTRRNVDGESSLLLAARAADGGLDLEGREDTLRSMRTTAYFGQDLHSAARTGDVDALAEALSKYNSIGPTAGPVIVQALLLAAENQNMGSMKLILQSPYVNVNDQDEDGFTALMVATIADRDYAVTKLRMQGASVVLESRAGRNASYFAVKAKRPGVFKALVLPMSQSPFDINHRDSKNGTTILHYMYGFDWFPDDIHVYNVDRSIRDNDGKMAMNVAKKPPNDIDDTVGVIDIKSFFSFESFEFLQILLSGEFAL